MLIAQDIEKGKDDSDDDRLGFEDARDEEITNTLLKSQRLAGRQLTTMEVDMISAGRIDNLKGSVLSHVMMPEDVQQLDMISQSAYSNHKRPQSRQIIFNSLIESQRS